MVSVLRFHSPVFVADENFRLEDEEDVDEDDYDMTITSIITPVHGLNHRCPRSTLQPSPAPVEGTTPAQANEETDERLSISNRHRARTRYLPLSRETSMVKIEQTVAINEIESTGPVESCPPVPIKRTTASKGKSREQAAKIVPRYHDHSSSSKTPFFLDPSLGPIKEEGYPEPPPLLCACLGR